MARRRFSSTSSIASSINRSVSPVSAADSQPDVANGITRDGSEYAPSLYDASEAIDNPFVDPSSTPTSNLPQNPFEGPEHVSPDTAVQQRNSIRKSLGIRGDGSRRALSRSHHSSAQYPSYLSRSHSTSSSASYAPSQAPTSTDQGPTHAYGAFDQSTGLSRSASLAASSVQRTSSTRSTRSRYGPAHPYNLYPQDVTALAGTTLHQIPVGFPGHVQQFQRRIGADGEEQDIIGSDGHAEQLPPYSRWPNDSTGKTVATGPMPGIGEMPSSRDNLVDLGDLSAQQQLQEDLQPRPETREPSPGPVPVTIANQSAPSLSEKPIECKGWRDKNWKEKSKTRVCCGFIPLWTILLGFFVILVIVVICGVFISAFVHHVTNKVSKQFGATDPAHYSSTPQPTPTVTYYDAAPTATPTYMSPLPTGTFIVPLGDPDTLFSACLDSSQLNAWTCALPASKSLCVELSQQDGTDRAFLSTCNNVSKLEYGTQPPWLVQQSLRLVTDLDAEVLGPAWHFQTFYDKMVVIPASQLQPGSMKAKRQADNPWSWPFYGGSTTAQESYQVSGEVLIGDSAWFCHWDDTFIEGFIYVTVSNPPPQSNTIEASSTPTLASSYNFASVTPSSAYHVTGVVQSSHEAYGSSDGLRKREAGETDSDPNVSYATVASGATARTTRTTAPPVVSTPVTAATSTSTKGNNVSFAHPRPSCMPKLVKFEERRLKGLHDVATCNLMLRLPDLSFKQLNDPVGQPIVVSLDEDDGPNGVNQKLKRSPMYVTGGGAALEKRQGHYVPSEVDETCFCQWSSEQFE